MAFTKKNEENVAEEGVPVVESGTQEDNEEILEDEILEDELEVKKNKKKKLPGWFILIILAAIIGVVILATTLAQGKKGDAGTELAVITVKTSDVKEVLNTSGVIKSEKERTIYSPVNAKVATSNAKVGEAVKAGTMLITFDTTDLEKNNQQAELTGLSTKYANQSTYEQTNKSIAKAKEAASEAQQQAVDQYNGVVNQYNAVANTIGSLQAAANVEVNTNNANSNTAQVLQSQMNTIKAQLDTKKVELDNTNRNLFNYDAYSSTPNPLSPEQLLVNANNLTAECSLLQEQYNKASGDLANLGVSSSAQEALGAANLQLATLDAQLETLKAALNANETSVDGLTNGQIKSMEVSEQLANLSTLTAEELVELGKAGITAEFDGVIADVQAQAGGIATQGAPLFTIVSNTDVGVKIETSINDYDKLKVGRKATIKISDKIYDGEVKSIDKIATVNAKGNSVICAYVHITNPDDAICIGVNGKITMTVAEVKDVIAVPNEVINTSTDGEFVYMIKEGVVKKIPVEIGVASDKMVEIKSGLKKGDKVVSDVGTDITEGMKAIATEK